MGLGEITIQAWPLRGLGDYMQPTQPWGSYILLAPCHGNEASGSSGASQVCHSGITRGGVAAAPRGRTQVLPAGSMEGTVTRTTLRGLRAMLVHKEAKVEELSCSSYVALPKDKEMALRRGKVLTCRMEGERPR